MTSLKAVRALAPWRSTPARSCPRQPWNGPPRILPWLELALGTLLIAGRAMRAATGVALPFLLFFALMNS
jgi:hypothetical protein